jgi:hypothetical protein
MIGKKILGVPMQRRQNRRWFVLGYWLAVFAALAVLWQFPMPPDVRRWTTFLPLLLTLGAASNLPLLLGGFSVGGAVSFYEGRRFKLRNANPSAAWRAWSWIWGKGWRRVASTPEGLEQLHRFLRAVKPADERETQLRDQAHHAAHRIQMWMIYAGAVAYLAISAINLELLARYGFVLLELLLVASMSLPQSCILWTTLDIEPEQANYSSQEAQCEPN